MGKRLKEAIFRLSVIFEEINAFIAIRQGLTMMIPVIVMGSFALALKSLPIAPYQEILPKLFDGRLVELLEFIGAGSNRIFSVTLAITTSISYAMVKNTNKKSERSVVNDCYILSILTLVSLMGYVGVQYEDFSVSTLGTTNTFVALIIALGTGSLYYKVRASRLVSRFKRADADVAGMYHIAVQSILPAVIVVGFFAVVYQLMKLVFHVKNLQEGLVILMEKVLSCFHTGFTAGLVILIAIHLMWFFGVHGSNVLDTVIRKNFTVVDGIHIYSKTFQDVFAIMGGCGAVLGLVIAILLFSRKKMIKNVAKLAMPTALFNISEVIVFGLPIIFNPIFFIPFLCVPLVNFVVAYGATYFGFVPVVVQQVEWTTPIFLSGYEATGSVAGGILQLVILVIDIAIYFPFIRLFETHSDRNMVKKVNMLVEVLQKEEDTKQVTTLTGREDMLGSIARLMATDLKEAIANKTLYVVYQPQVDQDGKCIGAEALLRWNHPIAGFIYPPLIIRLAKEIQMLGELEKLIFDEAAAALSILQKETDSPCKISVNITNESLMWDGFENMVDECVKRYDIPREQLWMEITEQDALTSSMELTDRLNKMKQKGHKFLIDDFGMGHTSLLYLQTNNFEIVKIDGSITRNIMKNERYIEILKSIVYLGNLLHFMTVAEYVETEEQVKLLKELGIDAFQGFYYSQPISLDELVEWIKKY